MNSKKLKSGQAEETGAARQRKRIIPFSIAFAGNGHLLNNAARVVYSKDFADAFPEVRVVARVAPEPDEKKQLLSALRSVPRYATPEEMFAAHPEIELVLNTTRNADDIARLQACAPPWVSVIKASGTHFFIKAASNGTVVLGGGNRLLRARLSFAALIDQLDEDVLVLDAKGKLQQANKHFLENSGHWLGDNIDGKELGCLEALQRCCGVDKDKACQWRAEGLRSRRYSEVYTQVTPEGQMRYFRMLMVPLLGERGEKRALFMRRDITEQVNIEQRLQQSEKMAAIGDLSTYIAHEIRNPLFAIGGFANALLRSPSLDEAAQEKARIILEESQRLDGILKSIINFARPTDSSVGEVDAGLVLRQTTDLMSIADAERGIKTVLDVAPNLPLARGNLDQIKQCLINLVKNSQEAMPKGGSLILRAFMKNNMVCLAVEDTGEGIPYEVQKQLFSPFFSTKSKGAGLGLAMTKKIVEEIGGKVNLVSEPGKGTTITLSLVPVLAVPPGELSIKDTPEGAEYIVTRQKSKI